MEDQNTKDREDFIARKRAGDAYQDEKVKEYFSNSKATNLKEYKVASNDYPSELIGEDKENYNIQKEFGDLSCTWGNKNIFYDFSLSSTLSLKKLHERTGANYFIHKVKGEDWVFERSLLTFFEAMHNKSGEPWFIKDDTINLTAIISGRTKAKKLSEHIAEMEKLSESKTISS